jgi:hypothetical protein
MSNKITFVVCLSDLQKIYEFPVFYALLPDAESRVFVSQSRLPNEYRYSKNHLFFIP